MQDRPPGAPGEHEAGCRQRGRPGAPAFTRGHGQAAFRVPRLRLHWSGQTNQSRHLASSWWVPSKEPVRGRPQEAGTCHHQLMPAPGSTGCLLGACASGRVGVMSPQAVGWMGQNGCRGSSTPFSLSYRWCYMCHRRTCTCLLVVLELRRELVSPFPTFLSPFHPLLPNGRYCVV